MDDPFLDPGKRPNPRRMSQPAQLPLDLPVERPPHIPPISWDRFTDEVKRKFSQVHQASAAREASKPPAKPHRSASRFTTDYAIEYGRAQGWKLVDREAFDARLNRHHDLPGGADARFRSREGVVFIQGAGVGERAEHRRRFEDRRHQLADFANVTFLYLEFVRGNKNPTKVEEWE